MSDPLKFDPPDQMIATRPIAKSIRPTSHSPHTLRMRSDDPIFPIAIEQIGLAVTTLIGWTGVHLSEHIPSKWRLRKASTRLKALETLVRWLILFMALQLDLEPPKPRPAPTKSASVPEPETTDGVELVEFPRARSVSLSLVPQLMDFSERPDLSHLPRNTTPAHIAARRFSRRIIALQKVLDAPEAHAKRLARHLSKLRKSGEPKPLLMPTSTPTGLSPEIGLLHGGLAHQLREALKAWDSS
ncbi:MAG: hypothetical protein AAFV54_09025 [Pseudomonadota bacterium]